MSMLTITGVSRRFGDAIAVDGVSLTVEPGEVVGLLGANGAGKTTLIRMVLGLLAPTSGRITVLGQPAGRADRRAIGYVPQGLGLYRDLTVAENLSFVAAAFGVDRPPLTGPSLSAVADRLVGEISLGLQRRVAFVAASCHQPQLLVLDEPTSGVGPLGRVELWETIHQVAEDGAGVLVTTHHMEEATECDRVLVLADGRQVAAGPVDGIVGDLTSVLVTGLAASELDRLRRAGHTLLIDGTGWRVAGASVGEVRSQIGPDAAAIEVPASFEEAFVALSR